MFSAPPPQFEKPFNHIDWGYFFEALMRLEFIQLWTKWVACLYKGASSSIKINNYPKPRFLLSWLIHHGWPLLPYLSIMATNVFKYVMHDLYHNIHGFILPRSVMIRNQAFANDITIFFEGSNNNLEQAKMVLKCFFFTLNAR